MSHPKEKSFSYYAVNALTVSRAVASLGVALTLGQPISYGLAAYTVLSDVVDGPLARSLHVQSFEGGILDNLSDLTMFNAIESLALLSLDKVAVVPWLYTEALALLGLAKTDFPWNDNLFLFSLGGVILANALHHSLPWVQHRLNAAREHAKEEKEYEDWKADHLDPHQI